MANVSDDLELRRAGHRHMEWDFAWPVVDNLPSKCSQRFAAGDAFVRHERLPSALAPRSRKHKSSIKGRPTDIRRFKVLNISSSRAIAATSAGQRVKQAANGLKHDAARDHDSMLPSHLSQQAP